MKLITFFSIGLISFSSFAHNEKENSHGCHEGKGGYHCHGDAVAGTQRSIDKKIVIQPSYMSNKKVIIKREIGDKKVLWKDGFVNRDEIMKKEIKDSLNLFYGKKMKLNDEITNDFINLIIRFQEEHNLIKDGTPSEELLEKIKTELKNREK